MPLQPGDRVGAYEILSTLGAGGMGVVYRARDAKLGRDVAIKTLPEDVAADPERLARFEREARMLAALNHPNIATVYGFEQADATHFLTMEVVEGATLADRIERGPIPLEQALPLFVQIAEGLEAAHAKGIIHRDLKPANIKIEAGGGSGTRPGAVKILDFGLAKALCPRRGRGTAAGASHSPTLTLQATMRGEILGTAAYMSPEQAEGVPADERADIWAFGVCLLEALTGRRVFSGANASLVLASVLKDEPDFDGAAAFDAAGGAATAAALPREGPRAAPPRHRRRAARDRGGDGDAGRRARVRRGARAAPDAAVVDRDRSGRPRCARSGRHACSSRGRCAPTPAPAPAARFVLNPPPNAAGGQSRLPEVAITADGNTVVYVARTSGDVLFVRRIDRLDGAAIAGVEPAAATPFLSPDEPMGRLRHFDLRAALHHDAAEGRDRGRTERRCSRRGRITSGASWGPDDTIVFGHGRSAAARSRPPAGSPMTSPSSSRARSRTDTPSFFPAAGPFCSPLSPARARTT